MNFDLLSIGDASLDTFISPSETESLCKMDSKECFIAFKYGEKIPVQSLDFSIGGNAANNAVGVSRLGLKAAAILTLGDDSVGRQIINTLSAEFVSVNLISSEKNSRSSYSVIINYQGERTIFPYHPKRTYILPETLPQTPWVYLTSLGENFREFYDKFLLYLQKNPTTKLAYNPGSWQIKAGLENIQDILKLTYVVFVNREEAEKLTGLKDSDTKEKELLQALARLGPKICVITDGNNGAFAFDGERYLKIGVMPIDAYERTGAGDAFGSGCLAALIKGKKLEEALKWGTVNSSSVIGYTGSQQGLLKENEMQDWLVRAESCKLEISNL